MLSIGHSSNEKEHRNDVLHQQLTINWTKSGYISDIYIYIYWYMYIYLCVIVYRIGCVYALTHKSKQKRRNDTTINDNRVERYKFRTLGSRRMLPLVSTIVADSSFSLIKQNWFYFSWICFIYYEFLVLRFP